INLLPNQYTVTAGSGSYCSGGTGVPIGLSNSDLGVSYQLFYGATPGIILAGTGGALTFGLYTSPGGPYSVVATNTTTNCTNNMLNTVTVTILPLPAVFNVTGGGSYCSGGTGVHIGLDGSVVGFNYQLYNGAVPMGSAVAGTGSTIDFGPQTTAATYTVLATNAISGCTKVMNGSATVIILPLPTAYTVAGGGTMCVGSPGFHVGLSNSDPGINYQLYNGSSTVGAPVAGTGGALDFGIFTTAGTYTVNATNTVTGCKNDMAGSAVFIVNPVPVVFNVSGGGSYCAGGTGVPIGLTGSEVGVNYQLFRGSGVVGLPVAGTGSSITFGLQTVAGTYTVSATNALTLCMSNMSGSTVVVINPNPTVYTVTGGGNYCVGGTGVNIGLTGSDLGVNYQPIMGVLPIGASVPGTGIAGPFNIGLETTVGTYSVVATNPVTGCTSNMTGDAIVGTNPLPLVFAVTGGGSYCAGGAGVPVGLANSTTGISYQLYNGSTAVGAPIVSPGGVLDFGLQTTAGTYSVQATNTVTTCTNDMSGNAVIIINPLPDPITGTAVVCEGSITPLSDDITGGAWSNSNTAIATVDAVTGVVTGVSAGTDNITYTLPTSCFITTPILVNQTPGAITGINSVCVGLTNTLSNALAGGAWSNSNTTIATVDAATGIVTGVSAGTDNITYSMPTGCFTTIPEIVNPLPFIPAIGATTTSVCLNSVITYTNAVSGGVWSSSNTGIADISATGDVTGISVGAATITYTFTNVFGCSNYVTLGVTVNPNPFVLTISGPSDVCAGGATITLSDGTPGGVWSSSNTAATINSSGVVTGVDSGATTIAYTVTNGFGCSTSTLYLLPVGDTMPASAILPIGSGTLCGGNPVNLSVVSSGGGPSSYQWLDNGTNISGATSSSYTATTAGVYEVIIGNGTCELTLAGTNIIAPPAPVIVYDSILNQLYTGSFTTYQWFFNGNAIPGATGSLITGRGNGVYKVVVSDVNGCHDTATFTLSTVGIAIQHTAKEIRIYPNPVTSILYIDAPGKVFVSVLSPDGRMLIERREAISINVGQLADGVYMIMIYDENNTLLKTDRFVKMQ
ncbi:MAG: Ig-like domain-containing protein, partial [Chitinophagales bacterium]